MAFEDLKLDDKFTNINPEELPEELKGAYKQMQGHFTKRVQEAVEARKTAESQATNDDNLRAEITALKQENTSLQTSLTSKEKDTDDSLSFLDDMDFSTGEDDNKPGELIEKTTKAMTGKISSLTDQIQNLEKSLESKTAHAMRMIQYQQSLGDLTITHQTDYGEALDRQALIDYAIKKEVPDLYQAYQGFSSDKLVEKKAKAMAETLYQEKLSKEEEFSGSSAPMTFGHETTVPKSMGEATRQILKSLKSKI